MMSAIRRFLLRLASFFRRGRAEDELTREIGAHLQLLEDTFITQGLSPSEARAAARRAFGGVEQTREQHRDARSFRWLDGMQLDLKLGVRLLVKYPGLTFVGGLAMAFAIWLAAIGFELVHQVVNPTLPLADGDRVVTIELRDTATRRVERRAFFDFLQWRAGLRSIEDLGAYRTVRRNLISDAGSVEPVRVAEMTAEGFRVARVTPTVGRGLTASDEQPASPPVAVIAYDIWQRRFAGDPDIVGRLIQLGKAQVTIVGVMPEGFAFPVNHNVWTPLDQQGRHEPRAGLAIQVVGRLAAGTTLDQSQAELTAMGLRAASDLPATHEHLRPSVTRYLSWGGSREMALELRSINLFFALLLVLACGNVALLVFARAMTREAEIAVRSALGASRRRIVWQLFAETLVLAGVATGVGLAAAGFGLRWGFRIAGTALTDGPLPFWFHPSLSPLTIVYACGLAVLAAGVAGVLPALKATRGLSSRLREATPGGGFVFGGPWTAVIVGQVALTVAIPVLTYYIGRAAFDQSGDGGVAAHQYLSARVGITGDAPEIAAADSASRFGSMVQELEERLESEPGVLGVTFADRLPLMYHPSRRIVLDEGPAAPVEAQLEYRRVSSATVALDFFAVMQAPVLSGRGFHTGDVESHARVVVVNQSFVQRVLGGSQPIGRRFRYTYFEETVGPPPDADRWYEIVGVVRDLGMARNEQDPKVAGIYHPGAGIALPYLAVHLSGAPDAFAPQLRSLAAETDPILYLGSVAPLGATDTELQLLQLGLAVASTISAGALLLSLTGIYSVLSLTVSRRTREIGIRIALGGEARHVITAIFRRPLLQVFAGVVAGASLAALFMFAYYGQPLSLMQTGLLLTYAVTMAGVCLLAAIVPTRRALQVQPSEALRADG